MTETTETPKFESWALLEIMGHQRYAGFVTEQAIGGASFVRVDVPEVNGRQAFTKLFGGGSIFSITPVSEEVARRLAATLRDAPVNVWDLRQEPQRALTAGDPDDEVAYNDIDDEM